MYFNPKLELESYKSTGLTQVIIKKFIKYEKPMTSILLRSFGVFKAVNFFQIENN